MVYNWPQSFLMLPAIHALTGFDSTCQIFGIGEKTALNICVNKILTKLGIKVESIQEIIVEASHFVVSCYGIQKGLSMTEKR